MKSNISIYPLLMLMLFLLFLSNCKKDENLPVNISDIEGTYNGTLTAHIPAAPTDPVPSSSISTLTKSSESIVKIIFSYGIGDRPIDRINVSKSGSIYYLSDGYDFKGNVDGNKLTWTLDEGSIVQTFSGTKSLGNAVIPSLSTTEVTNITPTSAISGGNITNDGGGTIAARGICWNSWAGIFPSITDNTITSGYGSGSFTTNLTGLTEHTPYRIRAYATNSSGTGYGDVITFETPLTSADNGIVFNPNLTYGTVIDIDGNVYKTIQIGTQTWMAENLKTTHYRNGDPIPNTTDDIAWGNLTGAYCWYNNDAATYKAYYGALYNWYAVTDSRNLAPAGWHVPSDTEWTTLTTFLGGESVAGGKLKETGITHWFGPNQGATNETGFAALPGGLREFQYGFYYSASNILGSWWSSTEGSGGAWMRETYYFFSDVTKFNVDKSYGCSIRCVKD